MLASVKASSFEGILTDHLLPEVMLCFCLAEMKLVLDWTFFSMKELAMAPLADCRSRSFQSILSCAGTCACDGASCKVCRRRCLKAFFHMKAVRSYMAFAFF